MPKVKQPDGVRIRQLIKNFGSDVLSAGSDDEDNSVLICKPCNINLNYSKKSNIAVHLKTSKHLKNVAERTNSGDPESAPSAEDPDLFDSNLCLAMVSHYSLISYAVT